MAAAASCALGSSESILAKEVSLHREEPNLSLCCIHQEKPPFFFNCTSVPENISEIWDLLKIKLRTCTNRRTSFSSDKNFLPKIIWGGRRWNEIGAVMISTEVGESYFKH